MVISVLDSMAIMLLQTHIIHWRKLKNTDWKIYSQTNYREQDSSKKSSNLGKN